MPRKRAAILKGLWYESDAAHLAEQLDEWLGEEHPVQGEPPAMLLVPHAGHVYSGSTAAAGYARLRGFEIDRIVLISPSHRMRVPGVGLPGADLEVLETPLADLPVARELCRELIRFGAPFEVAEEAIAQEHGLEVQLPFLARVAPAAQVCPLVCGVLDRTQIERAARALADQLDAGTVIVVSGDLTHYGRDYGFLPAGESWKEVEPFMFELDQRGLEHLLQADPEGWLRYAREQRWSACAVIPAAVGLWALPSGARGTCCAYATSAHSGGWDGRCVSYAAAIMSCERPRIPAPMRAELLDLARRAIAVGVRGEEGLWRELRAAPAGRQLRRGAFVTLRVDDQLRGCIGFPRAERPLREAVARAASLAARADHRFNPLDEQELRRVEITISVLSPLRELSSIEEIEIGLHGLVISWRGRSGLLLPQVAEEFGLDARQFVAQTLRKGGIPEPLPSDAKVEVFSATVFSAADS